MLFIKTMRVLRRFMILRAVHWASCEDNFATWFDNLEKSISYKEVQLKTFLPTHEIQLPCWNVNKTQVLEKGFWFHIIG